MRFMSAAAAGGGGLTNEAVTKRVVDVVKAFRNVKHPEKVSAQSHFVNDLGLDSLDGVEIVMAFEDEFGIEISEEESEKITSCQDAVNFILHHPNSINT